MNNNVYNIPPVVVIQTILVIPRIYKIDHHTVLEYKKNLHDLTSLSFTQDLVSQLF